MVSDRPKELERVSAHAGDELRLERADEPQRLLARASAAGMPARLVEIAAMLDELGAEGAHRFVLVG